MKLLVSFLLVLSGLSAHATSAPAPATVLVDSQTAVMFAPQQSRGVYHFQVLTDGSVQRVDNKDKVIPLAKLDPALVEVLKQNISKIQDLGLEDKDLSRGCMDAPTTTVLVHKATGEGDIKIAQRIQCIDLPAKDENAKAVAEKIASLEAALSALTGEL